MTLNGLESTVKIAPGAHNMAIHAFQMRVGALSVQNIAWKENNQLENVYSISSFQNMDIFRGVCLWRSPALLYYLY